MSGGAACAGNAVALDELLALKERSLLLSVKVAASVAVLAWYVSRGAVLNNTSTVDRLWSLLPAIYAWMFVLTTENGTNALNARSLLLALLISAWSIRLTYNFVRKGGYSIHAEDYRWIVTRRWFDRWPLGWELFNLTFICLYQSALILAFTLPVWAVVRLEHVPLDTPTCVVAALHSLLLYLQTLADEQQWQFHTAKQYFAIRSYRERKRFLESLSPVVRAGVLDNEVANDIYFRGFRTCGVFAYSRHLNFFCEQAMWWCVFAFYVVSVGASCRSPDDWLQLLAQPSLYWPATGVVLLTLLFQGSTWLTERITVSKYPSYATYQRRVPKFLLFK